MILRISTEAADGFLLNLAYTLTRETVFVADLFKRHLWLANAIERLDDTAFTVVQRLQHVGNFLTQRLQHQLTVGKGGIVVDQHVEQ